jgi:DNA polymerase-3 subunit delta'
MADETTEEQGGTLPPRANPELIGHEAAEAALLDMHAAGRLPHALLICGPRGIGKATFAYRLARFLFVEAAEAAAAAASSGGGLFGDAAAPAAVRAPTTLHVAPEHPVFRRVAGGGHADLMTVERGFDVRRKRARAEIVVDDTRSIAGFLHLTSAENGWRIVIVDSADEMNRNAANALLKILEEPPKRALLLLVSHAPGRLLPTIRSRCRKLVLRALPDATVEQLLARHRPDLTPGDAAALARLAAGSIGDALALAEVGGLDLYRAMLALLMPLPSLDAVALHGFAERLARPDADAAYRAVTELLPGWLARMIALAGGRDEGGAGSRGEIVPGEHAAMRRLAARRGLDQWVEVWEKINRSFAQADSVNLDRKQVVMNAFFALEGAAR